MSTVLIIGIVLAVAGFIVYISRGWNDAENKKAASDAMSEAALERTKILEETRIREEYARREAAQKDLEDLPSSPEPGERFYPERLLPNGNKDRLN